MPHDKQNQRWVIIKKIERDLLRWLKQNNIKIHRIDFLPSPIDLSTQVFVFFKLEEDLRRYSDIGITKQIGNFLCKEILDHNNLDYFNEDIKVYFDSDETVRKRYRGNYWYRLR